MPRDHENTTLGNIAPRVSADLNAKGCIVLTLNSDDSIGFTAHGMNHFKANELLSVGIHINLSQHDEAVRAGDAGLAAQQLQQQIDQLGGGE
jgi:hypothetical protein